MALVGGGVGQANRWSREFLFAMADESRKVTVIRDFEAEHRARWGRLHWLVSVVEYLAVRFLPSSVGVDRPRPITPEDASGMTVQRRLELSGLLPRFDSAARQRDETEMTRVLEAVHSTPEEIRMTLEQHRHRQPD